MQRRQKFPLLLISLYGCDNGKLDDADYLRAYTREMCREIDMKRRGRPLLARRDNGQLSGLSVAQTIETSHIIVHCYPSYQFVVIDIFSCREFDQRYAAEFSKSYFGASSRCLISRFV